MEKWPQERIDAWHRYLDNAEKSLADWERYLMKYEEGVKRAKSIIASRKKAIAQYSEELAEQREIAEGRK